MAIVATVFGWLFKNPLVVLIGLLAIGGALQTLRLDHAQGALATEKLAFVDFKRDLAEQSLKITKDAADRSEKAVNNLTEAIQTTNTVGAQIQTEIRYVQSNNGPCAADPAYLAGIDGVQRVQQARSGTGGDGGKARQAPASVVRTTRAAGPQQVGPAK